MMEEAPSILVVRLSSIGDIILTTPVVRRLKAKWPGAVIEYCTRPEFLCLLSGNPHISVLHTPDTLPGGSYDLIIDLQNSRRSRTLLRRVEGDVRVRYRKANWKKWLLVHLKLRVDALSSSVVERYQAALGDVVLQDDALGCELFPLEEDALFASSLIAPGERVLGVACGARHFTKRWPPEHFAEAIRLVADGEKVKVLLLGGKDDRQNALGIMDRLSEKTLESVHDLTGTCTLMQTGALLRRCDAVLTNDTGLMHEASAFSRRLFVLFGSSDASFGFLPYNTPFELFEVPGLSCRPCSHIGRERCPEKHFRCMRDILPSRVAESILAFFRGFA